MKRIIYLMLMSFVCQMLFGQDEIEKYINTYTISDSILFSISWEKKSGRERKIENTYELEDTILYKGDSLDYLVARGKDYSFHFLSIGEDTSLIESYRFITDNKGKNYFAKKITNLGENKSKYGDILIEFTEGTGPIFLLKIVRWYFGNNSFEEMYISNPYFSYPSWNPFIAKENIVRKEDLIIVPYCTGCQSGKDGELSYDTINYNKIQSKYHP